MRDLNDLQAFVAVVANGGFSAAARATGGPKSRLSRRVAALESELGVRLVERSSRRIQGHGGRPGRLSARTGGAQRG